MYQPKNGFRFSVDSPILADFLPKTSGSVLEVGCGSGIVSLLALFLHKFPAVDAWEIQPDLAETARFNAENNGFSGRMRVVQGDFLKIGVEFSGASLIFANPPFEQVGKGKMSRVESVRLAKFEVTLTLSDLLTKANQILAPEGKFCLIFPYRRLEEMLSLALPLGLYVVQLRLVRAFPDAAPDRFLATLEKTGKPLQEIPPLTIFQQHGRYSEEMGMILSGTRTS